MKVWLITGCSSGFGRLLAEQVLAAGGSVVMTARDPRGIADLVTAYPATAAAFALDIVSQPEIAAVVAKAEARFGRIDVLVNNAGYGLLAAVEEASREQLRGLFDVNFFGAVDVIRAVLPGMRKARSGQIINISSMGGITGSAGLGYYAATKAALGILSESLALEVAPLGIKVTVVEPGAHGTNSRANSLLGEPIEDYAQTAGRIRRLMLATAGQERGNARLAVQAILGLATEQNPPLHLPLGTDAMDRTKNLLDSRLAEIEKWRDLIHSTWQQDPPA